MRQSTAKPIVKKQTFHEVCYSHYGAEKADEEYGKLIYAFEKCAKDVLALRSAEAIKANIESSIKETENTGLDIRQASKEKE